MKKKLRRKLKDYFQIGNYIYANQQGYIAIVVPPKVYPKPELVSSDFQTLINRYGINPQDYDPILIKSLFIKNQNAKYNVFT